MQITKNKVVSIDYTLTDKNNTVLDSSAGHAPLDYLHGHGNIIPGLENALEGKQSGDHFRVTVPAAQAYGETDDRLIIDLPRENFKDIDKLEAGMEFQAQTPEGVRFFTVVKADDSTVTINGNHPLAGMDLTFDVTVAAVRDAAEEELTHGHVHHEHGGCGCGSDGCAHEGCGDHDHAHDGCCCEH